MGPAGFQLPRLAECFSLGELTAQATAADLQVLLSVRTECFVASLPGRVLMSGFLELAAGQKEMSLAWSAVGRSIDVDSGDCG